MPNRVQARSYNGTHRVQARSYNGTYRVQARSYNGTHRVQARSYTELGIRLGLNATWNRDHGGGATTV